MQSIGLLVAPHFFSMVDDFYAEINNHPQAKQVITGGEEQIARLKKSLNGWLGELFSGRYDRDYVDRRWRVGLRHVEIGLDQVYTNAALSRLRCGLLAAIAKDWRGDLQELLKVRESLNKLLDLDLALIEDAYQTEFQRRQAVAERAAAHQQAEQHYRSLFENTLDGLLLVDNEGRIIAVNPAACALLGRNEIAVKGSHLDTLNFRDNCASRSATWNDFFGDLHKIGEGVLQLDDGARVEVEYRAVKGIAPDLHLLSLHDVTARKQAEERARQSERLAAIGETMAALVHESRNALQRSKASLEMLTLEVEDRPEALKFVGRAQRAQDDLHRLYEEVRQWAAPLNLRREVCDLRELWKEVWVQVRQARPTQAIQLKEEVACDTACHVDPFVMGQVFRNIFENAVEASPAGAPITVHCSSGTTGKRDELVITISDEGPGLSAEQQRHIFEPFFTTKAKGTGLGMAIASRIVQSHGGSISARSPSGAQIEITLPRGDA